MTGLDVVAMLQLYEHGKEECDFERMDKVKCNQT